MTPKDKTGIAPANRQELIELAYMLMMKLPEEMQISILSKYAERRGESYE